MYKLAGFGKHRGTMDQIANIQWIIKKARGLKKIYFCSIDYYKAFDCMDHNKLWEILKERGTPDHLTCSWETCMQEKKQQLILDMEKQFEIGKGICQGCIFPLSLFNFYADYIIWNVRLDESQLE